MRRVLESSRSLCRVVPLVLGLVAFAGCEGGSPGEAPSEPAQTLTVEVPEEYLVSGAEAEALFEIEDGYRVSPVVPVHPGATRAGFLFDLWEDQAVVTALELDVRGIDFEGFETEWLPVTVTWAEPPHAVARADFERPVAQIQFRVSPPQLERISHILWNGVIPEERPDDSETGAPVAPPTEFEPETLAQQTAALSTTLSSLGVKPRSAWGAKATQCTTADSQKYRATIHHTATPPDSQGSYTARIKGMQAYHMDVNGWCDIGYHFLVTSDGTLWEGRDAKYLGAHTGGQNSGNAGISFVGCFHSSGCANLGGTMTPSTTMLNAAAKLLASLAKTYGFAVNTTTTKGHKDWPGQSTTCPGDKLSAKLGDLRAAANAIISGPVTPPPPATGRILGVVYDGAKTSSPTATGNVRLVAAKVSLDGKAAISVSSPDALFVFNGVAPGTHTLTLSAPGYTSATKTVSVTSGQDTWASTGLIPIPTTATLTVIATAQQGTSAVPLNGAIIHVAGVGAKVVGTDGKATFTLKKSTAVVNVFKDGYTAVQNLALSVPLGTTKTQYVKLSAAPATTTTGKLLGVVWDASVTAGPSDAGNVRVTSAIVTCTCGKAMKVAATSALWQFTAPPGDWKVTAIAPGYAEKTQTITAVAGQDKWGSIGVLPSN